MGRYDARARVQTCIYSQTTEAMRGPLSAAIRLMATICRCRWSSQSLLGGCSGVLEGEQYGVDAGGYGKPQNAVDVDAGMSTLESCVAWIRW